jgi:hypothetical protein
MPLSYKFALAKSLPGIAPAGLTGTDRTGNRADRPISYHSSKFLDCSLSNPSEITLEALAERHEAIRSPLLYTH